MIPYELTTISEETTTTSEEIEEERENEILTNFLGVLEKMDKELVECFTNPATSGKNGESSKMGALLGKGWCGSDDGNKVGEGFNN